jgi:hypothetical protein
MPPAKRTGAVRPRSSFCLNSSRFREDDLSVAWRIEECRICKRSKSEATKEPQPTIRSPILSLGLEGQLQCATNRWRKPLG